MKKKLTALLLSAALCLSLAACGQKAETPETPDASEPSGDAVTYTVGSAAAQTARPLRERTAR